MPVASRLQRQGMEHALDTLFERMKAIIPDPMLTHDEVTMLWAPKEHHALLKTAGDVAYLNSVNVEMPLTTPYTLDGAVRAPVLINMNVCRGKTPPLVPRAPEWQNDAPEEAKEKVRVWLEKRLELGRQFGLAKHLLRRLMKDFPSGASVRYVWPSILLLARNAPVEATDNEDCRKQVKFSELCDAWATKYSEFKAVPHPKLSVEFRNALRETSALLTAASMLTDDHVRAANVPREVTLDIHKSLVATELDGVHVYRM